MAINTEIKTRNIDEIINTLGTGEHGERLNDYRGCHTRLDDAISEIADADTSIYYGDILNFVGDHPEMLGEVIAEGLYDPSHNYDIYEHAQAAESLFIERELYGEIVDSLILVGLEVYRRDCFDRDHTPEDIPEELFDLITETAEEIENSYGYLSEMTDAVEGWIEDNTEEEDEE